MEIRFSTRLGTIRTLLSEKLRAEAGRETWPMCEVGMVEPLPTVTKEEGEGRE
jgi:hypothetical protein